MSEEPTIGPLLACAIGVLLLMFSGCMTTSAHAAEMGSLRAYWQSEYSKLYDQHRSLAEQYVRKDGELRENAKAAITHISEKVELRRELRRSRMHNWRCSKREAAEEAAKETAFEGCCKVCTVGKACGDTCIAAWMECHVGEGCACDAD